VGFRGLKPKERGVLYESFHMGFSYVYAGLSGDIRVCTWVF
jgi:hypothetical protein